MSNGDLIKKLDKLLQDVRQYESEALQLTETKQRIERLENSGKEKLKSFDEEYLPKYIKGHIGEKPKRFSQYNPKRLIKKFNNENLENIEKYEREEKATVKQYYTEFSSKRSKIESTEQRKNEKELSGLRVLSSELENHLSGIEEQFNRLDYFPKKYLKSNYLQKIIDYLKDFRADSLKEAINILCTEIEFKQLHTKLDNIEEMLEDLQDHLTENIETRLDQVESDISYLGSEINQLRNDITTT
jgi:hypothetical protein